MAVISALAITIHILASLLMIVLILLHSGKGGGLSDMFGGGMGPAGFQSSTVVERNLDRITVATALIWTATTFGLSFLLT